jgi:hypothetical protein
MRYLTKTRFRLGLECPTKLYYTGKSQYPDKKVDDPFLEQLANGGFQVEALARLHYPNGQMITSYDRKEATEETSKLLQQPDACLFEASFIHDNLHIRTDILVKTGSKIQLIEVKAKSSRSTEEIDTEFKNKSGGLKPEWEPYLWDVAYQAYVIGRSFPEFQIESYLMLVDKDAIAEVDGMHQCFKITSNGKDKRLNIQVKPGLKIEDLGKSVLCTKNVNGIVQGIHSGEFMHSSAGAFEDVVNRFASNYRNDTEIESFIGRKCKDCEFCLPVDESESEKHLDARLRCWRLRTKLSEAEIRSEKTYDIYYSGFSRKVMEEEGILLAKDLSEDHLSNSKDVIGYSNHDRQCMQLEDIISREKRYLIHEDYLSGVFSSVRYPLHMIDFETSTVAIPFTKGMHPYELVAFQFSHHVIQEDGKVEHKTQWLNTDPERFPNFDFVRALKKALEEDDGSIFRYHNHENTVLNHIKRQLRASKEPDRDQLIRFIESITREKQDDKQYIHGEREMIDLYEVVKRGYYNTSFSKSISLKAVLPAVITTDEVLQNWYARTIEDNGVSSLNFGKEHRWIAPEIPNGLDPYYLLPKPFEGYDDDTLTQFLYDQEVSVSNGGTAMMVYAQLQFTNVSSEERESLEKALLKYCETDTIAMVFIWEHLNNIYGNND